MNDTIEEWKGALLLLRQAALDKKELVEFFVAVQAMARIDGYELCRDYELRRMENDYQSLLTAVRSANSIASVTTHTPRAF